MAIQLHVENYVLDSLDNNFTIFDVNFLKELHLVAKKRFLKKMS